MTSKISCFKLLKEDLKSRSWLIILLFFACAVLLPVNYQMQLERAVRVQAGGVDTAMFSEIINQNREAATLNVLGSGSSVTMALILAAAVLCAATGFAYLHSREKVDFYHSLAVKRESLLAVHYLGGMLAALVPYVVCTLIALFGVGAAGGVMTGTLMAAVLQSMGFFCLAFGGIYTLCVLAMLLTGRVLTGILGMIFLGGYGPLCFQVIQFMMQRFFDTYYVLPGSDSVGTYLSPVTLMIRIGQGMRSGRETPPLMWIVLALFLAGGFLLCLLAYRKRPSEAAENAVSYHRMESVVKVAVTIPGALGVGFLAEYSMGYSSRVWFVAAVLLGALLLNGAVEFIYSFDIRNIWSHRRSAGVALAGTATVILLFSLDPLGYDRWRPDTGEVEAMSLYSYRLTEPLAEYYTMIDVEEAHFLESGSLKDFMPVYELAVEGIQNLSDDGEGRTGDSVTVCYFLKNGGRAYRSYQVSTKTLDRVLDTLSQGAEFRGKYYPSEWEAVKDAEYADAVDWKNFRTEYQTLALSTEELQELTELYREETRNLTYGEMLEEQPVSTLVFSKEGAYESGLPGMPPESLASEVCCYLYPQHEKTLAFLRGHGMTEDPTEAAEVGSIMLDVPVPEETAAGEEYYSEENDYSAASETYLSHTYYTEEEIRQVLSSVKRCRYSWNENTGAPAFLQINYKDGSFGQGYCTITDMDRLEALMNESE